MTKMMSISMSFSFAISCAKSSSNPIGGGSRIPRSIPSLEFYKELGLKKEPRTPRTPSKEAEELVSRVDFAAELGSSSEENVNQSLRNIEKEDDEELIRIKEKRRSGRQLMRRSNIIAKQVISIQSALSLGFVSQLWVDTHSWVVLVVEVKPNLLSGEPERFLLEDIKKVGDVLLIEDESVMENELKSVRLETLVGYAVVTPARRNIGKVRGYTFNINSGAVESLELDSFGISIIPSSLVSTYALSVEDVLEVLSDAVVVHEAAGSRMQRLTKGLWDTQSMGSSTDEIEEYSVRPDSGGRRNRKSRSRKLSQEMVEPCDEWELPMDYL